MASARNAALRKVGAFLRFTASKMNVVPLVHDLYLAVLASGVVPESINCKIISSRTKKCASRF